MKGSLTDFSIRYPWAILILVLVMVVAFATQFPKVRFDNDPENMLSPTEPVRIYHNSVKDKFNLYDFVIVGIVNEENEDGIFNVGTLGRIYDLTHQLMTLRKNEEGQLLVTDPARGDRVAKDITVDLSTKSKWLHYLDLAFKHDPHNLFDEDGKSAIITNEIISPSVVDNIKQSEFGSLKIEYLMENPPSSREEALEIKHDIMVNPLYKGTLASEDGKAIAIYIPIKSKEYSYNVANLVKHLTADWIGKEKIYLTGLPVAEDTFGVEMLVQMATSAPMAGLAIFVLLLFFFGKLSIIIAPMIVAIVSVVCTMGLLIGLGFEVHIMSSMIAIFLMPIAVADSVHILSEFYDTYHDYKDRVRTLQHVISHLFKPMLFTSLTTMAGFASLAITPIPPVRVFGLHVAFGVGLAWLLTITFIPAYIMLIIPQWTLDRMWQNQKTKDGRRPALNRFLEGLGKFSYLRWKFICILTILILVIAGFGMSRIVVNDNPVKWFTPTHEVRIADRVMNKHFGGTYTAYLTLSPASDLGLSCNLALKRVREAAQGQFEKNAPEVLKSFYSMLSGIESKFPDDEERDLKKCFKLLREASEKVDEKYFSTWIKIADAINYMDPDRLKYRDIVREISKLSNKKKNEGNTFLNRLKKFKKLRGEALQTKALDICDDRLKFTMRDFITRMETQILAPLFKNPQILEYVAKLQDLLSQNHLVGKTSSAVDALKKATYELNFQTVPANATVEEKNRIEEQNLKNFRVPETAAGVGQVFTQLEGMKKKDSLFHLITRDYNKINIWVQLKSGDNLDMLSVVRHVEKMIYKHKSHIRIRAEWAGLTYLNVVWQDKMVYGMLASLAGSFLVVLIMMIVLFRSVLYGIIAMIPLSVTISFIYGLIGIIGKEYDMPVAVLSALTLGLSIDFAIHFLERAREIRDKRGSWELACREMFKEPAMAISRNAIIISIGFTPLLAAPLVPYKTVGFFLATIMAVSWLATLFILPALITMLRKRLFDNEK